MSETASTAGRLHRDVSLPQAAGLFFKNYFDFKGRTSRGGYWWAYLFTFLVSIVLGLIDGVAGLELAEDTGVLGTLFSLLTLIPGIAIGVRRLHDVGNSGWWLLLILTIIGIFYILYLFIQPGDEGTNKYGEDVEAGREGASPEAEAL